MIGYLHGKVIKAGVEEITVYVSGVGYIIKPVGCRALVDQEISWWIHDYVREDRRELYGFDSEETREFFEKLVDINGIGHKLAQKMLSTHFAAEIRKRILESDIAFLTNLPGIGTKTAQKIILELKGKLVSDEEIEGNEELIDALIAMGYKKQQLKDINKHVTSKDIEGQIREALKYLSKAV